MRVALIKTVTLGLAAVMVVGTLDAASARQKTKHRSSRPAVTQTDHIPGTLVPVDRDGTPIIMQGYRSPSMMRDSGQPEPRQRADPEQFVAALDRVIDQGAGIPQLSKVEAPPCSSR